MRKQVFAVRDAKAGFFGAPIAVLNEGVAVRGFSAAVRGDRNADLWNFADDYALFHLGEYDELTGQFFNLDQPTMVVLAATVKSLMKEGE
ncbi:VP5 [Gokushovirus WZ-2015a]|nr:VP5 [Gokushovirus WZ-2015a]